MLAPSSHQLLLVYPFLYFLLLFLLPKKTIFVESAWVLLFTCFLSCCSVHFPRSVLFCQSHQQCFTLFMESFAGFSLSFCSKHNLSFSQNSDAASATSGSHVALLQLPFLSASSTTSRFHAALLCFLFAARTSGSHSSLLQQAQLYKPAHSHSALLFSFSVCSKHNWGS